VIIKLVNQK